MTYRERQRLTDIQAAIKAIRSHLQRGDLSDGLVFDAVRIRLLEIGEAVKALPAEMDIGSGVPTADNTHQVAQRLAPESRVVYADRDPTVAPHARSLLRSTRAGTTDYP